MSNTSPEHSRASAWRAVVSAYQTCNQQYSRLLEHFDLTIPQFDVLYGIDALGGRALPSQISKRLLVTKANISGVSARLESRGLIRRQSHHSDGRSFVLSLTTKGKQLTAKAKKAAATFVDEQLSPFEDQEVDIVGRMMREMHTHLLNMNVENVLQRVDPHLTFNARDKS